MLHIIDERIPEGKIISTIHGDPRALEVTMEKLKKFGFTGYILTKIPREGYVSEGCLILKDGNLTAAIYGRRVNDKFIVTKKGEEGLKLAWGDSYDKMCDLEVHGRLDIGIILQSFPMSRLDDQVEKKTAKRRTRFSLEWGNKGEAEAPEEIGRIPEDLRAKLEEWRSAGYVVKFLQEEIRKNPEKAAVAFEQFEGNIRRAEFLKRELDSLDCRKFSADVERLKAMVKNPFKITAIEAALQGLKVKIEQEKLREREEKLVELMAQEETKPVGLEAQPVAEGLPATEPRGTPAPAVPEPTEMDDFREERLAGQGDIIPSPREAENRCTVCGSELYEKSECPTCGADNSQGAGEPKPQGDSNLIPEYTFDTFVLGDSNRFSHSAAMAVSRPGTSPYNPLSICGGSGLGKTHILNAIGNSVISSCPDKKVLYISTESFMNEFMDAVKNNRKRQFRKKFHEVDIILIDDINLISGQEMAQDELYHILNGIFKSGKQVVVTSDRPIRELADIKERVASLFDTGLSTELHPVEFDTRLAILKKKSRARNMELGDDVLQFVAGHSGRNIRMLEGTLKTLLAYSELMNAPPNLETAKLALKDVPGEPEAGSHESPMPFEKGMEKLKLSHSYLVEESRPVKCFEHFVDNLNLGMRGLALTRVNPKRLREDFDLGGAAILWLTDKEGDAETRLMPVLEKIIYRIEDFLNSPGKSILLLDGLDYLISNNNFDSVLKFLRRLIDEVSESDAIFIASVTPDTLDPQALNILEREMEILSYL